MIQQNADNLASVLFQSTLICRYCGRTDPCFLPCATENKCLFECWKLTLSRWGSWDLLWTWQAVVGSWCVTAHEDKPHLCSLKPSVWELLWVGGVCSPTLGAVQDTVQITIGVGRGARFHGSLSLDLWLHLASWHFTCALWWCPALPLSSAAWEEHGFSASHKGRLRNVGWVFEDLSHIMLSHYQR